jgi:LmbE family N-acetylglucosaminyl deacetylase
MIKLPNFRKILVPTAVLSFFLFTLSFQIKADNPSEILLQMQRLGGGYRVLYIAAHPDDENTRLISWLTNVKKVECAYLSLTRGDGGQNLIGSELGDALGLIRTEELLAARRTDGAKQFFTRARDFGYSKTATETLEKWDETILLEDMVWVIRYYRPDVIITRFSAIENPERPTHGHHTASAILAQKAFKMAADPTAFPDQLKKLKTWQPKQLLWNTSTWMYGGNTEKLETALKEQKKAFLKVYVTGYVPLQGMTCSDIAARSRSMHKSQGFGSSPGFGEQNEYLEYIDGAAVGKNLFDGIPGAFDRHPFGKKLREQIKKAELAFDPNKPWGSVPALLEIAEQYALLQKEEPRFDPDMISNLAFQCSGIQIKISSTANTVARGDTAKMKMEVFNSSSFQMSGFSIKTPDGNLRLLSDLVPLASLTTEIMWLTSSNTPLSQPYWLEEEHSEALYKQSNGLRPGEIVIPETFTDIQCSWQIGGKQMSRMVTPYFRYTDPVKGEMEKAYTVVPRAALAFDHSVYLFSSAKPTVVNLKLEAFTAIEKGYVELNLPSGFKSEPAFHNISNLEKGKTYQFLFSVAALANAKNVQISAMLKETEHITSVSAQRIGYDHIPSRYLFFSCKAHCIVEPIRCSAKNVAFIHGAGDETDKAIQQLGCSVTVVPESSVLSFPYQDYDVVVLGIRTYNTLKDIDALLPVLFDYTNKGGTVIVQYITIANRLTKKTGPLNFELGRGRVTEENADVNFSVPDPLAIGSKVLNIPTKIHQTDFDGWVQERGLYFAASWDPKYDTPLIMADKGEIASKGSLLILSYGKGHFVYTGLSFFRQLPAGVPGAYKLMGNLLSLGKE